MRRRSARARVRVLLALGLLLLGGGELLARALPEGARGYRYAAGRFRPPLEFRLERTQNTLGFHEREPEPKPPARLRVLLLGDARVAARELPLEQGLARRLAAELERLAPGRFDVVALAREGWGLREELDALRALGTRLEPDLVLVLLDLASDVAESSGLLKAFGPEGRGEPALRAEDAPALLVRASALNRWLSFLLAGGRGLWRPATAPAGLGALRVERAPEWARAWEATLELLNALREESQARGARLLLATAPTRWDLLEPSAALAAWREGWPELAELELDPARAERELAAAAPRADLVLESLVPSFRARAAAGEPLFFAYADAWTAAAHALAARELARFVVEHAP